MGIQTQHRSAFVGIRPPRESCLEHRLEVAKPVNPQFTTPPHIDVDVSFANGPWKCAAIEAKFCEPYSQKPRGLKRCYLDQTALWEGRPNLRNLAEATNPVDRMHSSLHAAQLIQHLLGLRKQHDKSFVLIYLWFDVPNAPDAATHRQEVESFGRILKSDGIAFVSRTYQEVFQL